MPPKVRDDLEFYNQEIDGEELVIVHDPIRSTWFRFNVLQVGMLRALDGNRTPGEISSQLSAEYDVEIPPIATERFIKRAQDLMLLEVTSYKTTPARARRLVRKGLRKAGFRLRTPDAAERPRVATPETLLFAEAFHQLDLGHLRAAASYLTQVLKLNPNNARARTVYEIVRTAYLRSFGGTTDYPTFVLFNPSRLLTWLSRKIGWLLFGWVGIFAIAAWVCLGAYASTMISFDQVSFGAFDILVAYLMLEAGGIFHELGHGFACQHYGGNVTEIGYILFFYFRLSPYCDTSSSYLIANRRHKVIVQIAGTVASVIWNGATAMWLAFLAPSVPIYSGLAIVLVLDSAFMFLNLIPLLKTDGYYAVADYYNIPNLRERSFKLAYAWLAKRLFGLDIETEELPEPLRRKMIAFGIAARLSTMSFILFFYLRMIVTPLVEHFRGLGLVVAILLSTYMWRNVALRPIWKAIRTFVRERRTIFSARRTAILVAIVAVLVGPWFLQRRLPVDTSFVVVPRQRSDVRARTGGRVDTVLVKEGDHVRANQPLATLRNPELVSHIATLEAERETAGHQLADLKQGARPEDLALAKSRLEKARAEVRRRASAASNANRLAQASLGTQTSADSAASQVATQMGVANSAQWQLSLLEAGARPEAIAMAEAECSRLDEDLAHLRDEARLLTVRSPIDGVVATPHLEDKLQSKLAAGEIFAEVHDDNKMIAELSLAPSEPLSEIRVGDEVVLRPYGAPDLEVKVRIDRFREAVQDSGDQKQVIAVTSPFSLERPIAGLTGHARIYGSEHTLAYDNFYLPVQRIVRVKLWSMW